MDKERKRRRGGKKLRKDEKDREKVRERIVLMHMNPKKQKTHYSTLKKENRKKQNKR